MSYSELPVTSITNANLQWVRMDFGPMDQLAADIKKNGMLKPVLLGPDYKVLDGARRIEAAKKIKMTYVPVVICRTWDQFVEHFDPIAPDVYPLTWLEIRDLIDEILRPLYREFQHRTASATRDHRREIGAEGHAPRQQSYSLFMTVISDIFKVQPVHMKMLNDNVRRLHFLREASPEFITVISQVVQSIAPELRRDLALIRILKTVITRFERGSETAAGAGDLLKAQLAAVSGVGGLPYSRRKKNVIDSEAPVVSLAVIRNFAGLLEDLGHQADGFRNFKPTTQYQLTEFAQAFRTVVRVNAQLYRLRRRMSDVLPNVDTDEPDPNKETTSG